MVRKVLPIVLLVILVVLASHFFVGVSRGDVNINNVGNVQINTTTQCNTGGNVVAGQNSGIVTNSSATTGNANCGTNVQTQVNTNTVTVGSSPTPTPTVDPCVAKPGSCATSTPTPTPNTGGGSTGGGSGSSGSSSSSSSSSKSSSPMQAILGASTMASTGTFDKNLMNVMLLIGTIIVGAGIKSYAKEKNR